MSITQHAARTNHARLRNINQQLENTMNIDNIDTDKIRDWARASIRGTIHQGGIGQTAQEMLMAAQLWDALSPAEQAHQMDVAASIMADVKKHAADETLRGYVDMDPSGEWSTPYGTFGDDDRELLGIEDIDTLKAIRWAWQEEK